MAAPAAVLNIIVGANTTQASAALTRLQGQLKGTQATAAKTSTGIGTAMAKGAKVGALALAGIATGSIVAAARFEDAFADVRKTVDASEAEFNLLEQGILSMSRSIPVSANELAHLAGEAGALGIETKSLLRFTRVAADLGVATDLSASDAANALARLGNIMEQRTTKDFERMGATLVDLGNKGASTESEISQMALRIAGAGKTIGLSAAQVLGLAAALSNVGIRAEMGGSAISRVMLEMQDAVVSGGKELSAFADISDMSAKQFITLFKTETPAAIAAFTKGLDDINKSGGSVSSVLEEVGLNEIRVRDTLLRLAGATGQVTTAQQIANKAWGENTALATEAEKRYATTSSQFEILKNRIFATGVMLGAKLLPAMNAVMGVFGAFAASDFFGPALIALTAYVTAFYTYRAVLWTVGAATKALTLATIAWRTVMVSLAIAQWVAGLVAYRLALVGARTATLALIAATVALNVAMRLLPWIAIATAVAIAAALIIKHWDRIKQAVGNGLAFVRKHAVLFGAALAPMTLGMSLVAALIFKNWDKIKGAFSAGVEGVKRILNGLFWAISQIGSSIAAAFQWLGRRVQEALQWIIDAVNAVKGALGEAKDIGVDFLKSTPGGKAVGAAANALGLQRGGSVVPGHGVGDKVPALLEPGEVVWNKRAVAAMGGALQANAANSMIPRFAGGGIAEIYRGAVNTSLAAAQQFVSKAKQRAGERGRGTGISGRGVAGSTARKAAKLAEKFGLTITSGYRSPSHNAAVGGAPNSSHMRGSPSNPGAHDFSPASEAAMRFAVAKWNPLWADIHPPGPHLHISWFQKGGIVGDFARAAVDTQASKKATFALFMAGLAESGMRDLPGGHSTSEGVLQLLASTASGMGINPHDEYAVAKAFLTRGYWGKGGAITLAKQGNSAATVAHLVQGNATGTGVYSAQAGAAQELLRGSGLRFPNDVARLGALKEKSKPLTKGKKKGAEWSLSIPQKLQDEIARLAGEADLYDEFGQRASTLDGMVGGRNEVGWLQAQLEILAQYRNALITAYEWVHTIILRYQEAILAAQAQIAKLREGWANLSKGQRAKRTEQIEALQAQIAKWTEREGVAIQLLTGEEGPLAKLNELQGTPTDPAVTFAKGALPEVGVLGGRIFEVQAALKTAGESTSASAEIDTTQTELLKEMAEKLRQQLLVSQQQYKVFQTPFPYVGGFAEGGIVPGPIGAPRLATVHGGEAIGQPGLVVLLIEDGAVDAKRIRRLSGAEARRALRRSTRRANRPLPSAGGGL